jgi:hypothetical protein
MQAGYWRRKPLVEGPLNRETSMIESCWLPGMPGQNRPD